MTIDEALALYAKPQTTQAELARMVLAGHALAREVERLRERCAHPEDFCGCATNRTGEEVLATCEWHTYPTTFAEKAQTMTELRSLRLNLTSMQKFTDEIKAECAALRQRHEAMTQAVGLATTIKGDMAMRADDPIGMMQEVVAFAEQIGRDLAALREQRCETCRHSFRQEGLPDAYCGRTTFRISRPEDLSVVSWLLTATCDDLGNGCRAWARREP